MTDIIKCWNCGADLEATNFFCTKCNKIQPPSQQNHFQRLGVSEGFDIGIKNLEVAYFAMQTKLHPDRFAQKSEKERMMAMQQSTSINEAYEVLKSPLSRAEYMLFLQGIVVNKDNANVKPSQEVLLENLEIREKLSGDLSEEEQRQITISTTEDKLATIESIKQGLEEGRFEDVAQNTIKLRYLEKIIEEIKRRK